LTDEWAAGFFDGEGCVYILNGQIRVTVTQVDPRPLRALQAKYGGHIYLDKKPKAAGYRRVFRWNATPGPAKKFLASIRPFLVVKGEEADVAIAYQLTLTFSHKKGQRNQVPAAVRRHRITLVRRLKALKHRRNFKEK
jgi:hypothetical protein